MKDRETIISMLYLISEPAFCADGTNVIAANQAAVALGFYSGTILDMIPDESIDAYRSFSGGTLHLTLKCSEETFDATVSKVENLDIFVLDKDRSEDVLQSLALASQHLRMPLSDVITIADRLMPQLSEGDTLQAAHLRKALYQIQRILNNMSSAANTGKEYLQNMELIDATAFFGELMEKASIAAKNANMHLDYTGPAEATVTLIDKERMEQAVYNLISNAIKFSPTGSKILCSLTRRSNTLIFTVSDSGATISREKQGDIYAQFLRVPAVEEGRIGLGLGMFLVRSTAKLHGGTVLMESEPDRGTKVTMTLAIREDNVGKLRSDILCVDSTGGWDPLPMEFSDVLPAEFYK